MQSCNRRSSERAALGALLVAGAIFGAAACGSDSTEVEQAPTRDPVRDSVSDGGQAPGLLAAITVRVDKRAVALALPEPAATTLDFVAALPPAAREVATWSRLVATGRDGRQLTVDHPHQRYPGFRLQLRVRRGAASAGLWLLAKGAGSRDRPITTLADVERVDITTRAAAQASAVRKPPPVNIALQIGTRTITVPWAEVSERSPFRPRGLKRGGYRLRDVIAAHIKLSRVARAVVHAPKGRHVVAAATLHSDAEFALFRLNRRGLIRFRHYAARVDRLAKPGRYRELGGLRAVDRIVVELK